MKARRTTFMHLCLPVVALTACFSAAAHAALASRDLVRTAKSWSIQLQGDVRSMQSRNTDVAVVDPDEVTNPAVLKHTASGGTRAVLAYISIGEAEEGRTYMARESKPWLTREDQGWAGNYKVRFWDEEWKSIVKGRVRAALKAGYDGVFLDRVDTYQNIAAPGGSRKEMVKFVREIADDARTVRSDAAVVVQNAEELLTDEDYIFVIDAISKEDLYHGMHHDGRRNGDTAVQASVSLLKMAQAEGKGVFVIEYLEGEEARRVKEEARRDGFVPSTGDRLLKRATED